MQKYVSKILILIMGIVLGISKEAAAQYGVVSCNYLFKGKVESGLCEKGIEGIRISILDPSDSTWKPRRVLTGPDGRYELTIGEMQGPGQLPEWNLRVEDVDGEANGGKFETQCALIRLDASGVFETGRGDWEMNYRVLGENIFLLRKKDGLPCLDEKQ